MYKAKIKIWLWIIVLNQYEETKYWTDMTGK